MAQRNESNKKKYWLKRNSQIIRGRSPRNHCIHMFGEPAIRELIGIEIRI